MIRRILITLAAVAFSQAVLQLTVPGVDKNLLESAGHFENLSVLALGLRPMIIGFLFIELGSFLLPRGRRLRRSGIDGRRRLNVLSVRLGVILAAVQALGIAWALAQQSFSLLPTIPFLVLATATLVAGALVAFLLAGIVSRWGVCNGIALLICFPILWASLPQIYQAATSPDPLFMSNLEPLMGIASVAMFVWFFARRPKIELISTGKNRVFAVAPALPQGAVPIGLSMGIFSAVASYQLLLGHDPFQSWRFDRPNSIWLSLATLMASCFLAFYLFSSGKRLATNLPSGVVVENSERPIRNRVLVTSFAFVIAFTLYSIGESLLGFHLAEVLGLLGVILLTAFGFDVAEEIQFRWKYGDDVASVLEMDNVYGATYLSAVLGEAGIDSAIRAFHFRSLFFFLQPIAKMELLVPAEKASEAQGLIQSVTLEIV